MTVLFVPSRQNRQFPFCLHLVLNSCRGNLRCTTFLDGHTDISNQGSILKMSIQHLLHHVNIIYTCSMVLLLMPLLAFAAIGQAYPGDLDWTQPLRGATTQPHAASDSPATATTTTAANSGTAPFCGAGCGTSPQQQQAVELGLQLLSELHSTGLHDVARHAARLLLRHAGKLSAVQLSRLAAFMSEVGLQAELPRLLREMVLGAEPLDRETTGGCTCEEFG